MLVDTVGGVSASRLLSMLGGDEEGLGRLTVHRVHDADGLLRLLASETLLPAGQGPRLLVIDTVAVMGYVPPSPPSSGWPA